MKTKMFIVAIATFILLTTQCKNRMPDNDKVALLVTVSEQYCGGAAPDEKMIEELAKPKPLSKDTIYLLIENGLKDNLIELTTDSKGYVEYKLDEGVYEIFLFRPIHLIQDLSDEPDMEQCEAAWKSQIIDRIIVDKDNRSFNINFFKTCNPCVPPRP